MTKIAFEELKERFKTPTRMCRPRNEHRTHKDPAGWCLFVGYDRRGYAIFVQRLFGKKGDGVDRQIRVIAGCRNFTLRQAMNHWGRRNRGQDGKAILSLIDIGLKTARYNGWISSRFYPKFFDTKVRR